jgi:23S rRNA pseudouridine1911/1915/1917 synthase
MSDHNDDADDLIAILEFRVNADLAGERLDKALTALITAECPDRNLTRSKIEQLIAAGSVRLNGKAVKTKSLPLEEGGKIEIEVPDTTATDLPPDSSVQFEILYEDEDLAVINKPAGLIVHPGDGNEKRTLAHGLRHRYSLSGVGHPKRPGIVHRLDKDTSGVMVVALNIESFRSLLAQFLPPRKIHREYLAFTRPSPRSSPLKSPGVIDAPIGRDPKNPVKMAVRKDGREAVTRYAMVEEFQEGLLLRVQLETGRTHQIRVHLEHIGISILGDQTYNRGMGNLSPGLTEVLANVQRQALHAARLTFEHPRTGERMTFEAQLPSELDELITYLRGQTDYDE